MSDTTMYMFGVPEASAAAVLAGIADFETEAQAVTDMYNTIDDTCAGTAVEAGVEFNTQMAQLRADVIELGTEISSRTVTASAEHLERDLINLSHIF